MEKKKTNPLIRVWRFYIDGFKGISKSSKMLWLIIVLKLFIMFGILKVFFFHNYTKEQAQKHNITGSEWVQKDLIDRGVSPQIDSLNNN